MSYKIEAVSKDPFLFGETPLWDHRDKKLYLVDCFDCSFACYDPLTTEVVKRKVDKGASGTPLKFLSWSMPCEEKGQFIVSTSDGQLVQYDWGKEAITNVISDLKTETAVPDGHLKSYNDAKCDSKGRLWVGTNQFEDLGTMKVATNHGSVHSVSKAREGDNPIDFEVKTFNSGYDVPNGLGWNKEYNKFFHNDLIKRVVKVYDFDLSAGTLSNRKTLFDYKNHAELDKGFPDGLTVDLDGNLYIASWKGASIIKIDAHNGKLVETINCPATNTTSVCFGGEDFSSMFVTTTSIELDMSVKTGHEPDAGKLFQIANQKDNRFKGFQQHFFHL